MRANMEKELSKAEWEKIMSLTCTACGDRMCGGYTHRCVGCKSAILCTQCDESDELCVNCTISELSHLELEKKYKFLQRRFRELQREHNQLLLLQRHNDDDEKYNNSGSITKTSTATKTSWAAKLFEKEKK